MTNFRVYYTRTSSVEQNVDRQLHSVNSSDFDLVLTDRCSGLIPLFDRAQGSQIKRLIDQGKLTHLEVHNLDRLGRSSIDVLSMFKLLTEKKIRLVCRTPYIENFAEDGTINGFSELLLGILSSLASYERNLILERQAEGIAIRKMKGLYTGRRINTQETPEKFLNKKKSKQILEYLALGYSQYEIKQILGCSYSTISKVKRLSQEQDAQKAD
jgi:DNA invertase Pin-like site-specific DNA recombinase